MLETGKTSNIQQAYQKYFEELNALYDRVFGTKPTVPYSEEICQNMLIGNPDDDDEIQWSPRRQSYELDWDNIEEKLGFALNIELKEFYNTFFFLSMSGMFGSAELHFHRIDGSEPVENVILRNYTDAQYFFPGTECFILGNAVINNDDGYFIFFENNTGRLFCFESNTKKEVLLSYSIAKTISSMEASL